MNSRALAANAPSRALGWCPGALRPMQSGDGLIVRLRLSCGELPPALARDIADWAETFGNGRIDLSARANLQLRGISPSTLPPLLDALRSRGLLDASAEAEAVRNVLVSPFAGEPTRGVARALEAELAARSALWRLPAKFGFSFDEGPFPLGPTAADVAFEAIGAGVFQMRLGGAAAALGPVGAHSAVALAVEVARMFLDLEPKVRRMRDAVARFGMEALADRLGLGLVGGSAAAEARPLADILGVQPGFVGAALPFGRIRADGLRILANAAASLGATLRLTPWRVILALPAGSASQAPLPPPPSWGREAAAALVRELTGAEFILDARDPRLRMAACVGAPACDKAEMDTRAEAAGLADWIARAPGSGLLLHLSGCAKGCAHPAPAPYTIVGERGRYALIGNGRAGDAPNARGLERGALRASLEKAS